MENELISVIVPVYNTGAPLKRCVEGILDQTYSPLEIILVDDGSTDEETLAICDEYEKTDNNITVIHQANGGAAKARNTGIDNAHGKYIAFVDSDDVIDPDAYSNLYSVAKLHKSPVVLGALTIEGAHQSFGDCGLPDGVYGRNTILSKFLQGYWCSACTNLYSIEIIKDIRFPVNEINEDYLFNFKILLRCERIAIVNKPFYHYVRTNDSVTSKPASLKHLDWIKHTIYIREQLQKHFGNDLKYEADFQYLYANIILSNKCIINFSQGITDEPNKLYPITVGNLKKEKYTILRNPLLKTKYRISGICLIFFPNLYKHIASQALKLMK